MFQNYFKIIIRSIARNKLFSFVNVFGLAIGLATSLLITLYILSELGYDSHHKDADRVYRVATIADQLGSVRIKPWAASSAPTAWGLKADLPEVEEATRLLKFPLLEQMILKNKSDKGSQMFYERNGYYVDSNFFRVFNYEFKYGNALNALDEPNSIMLSESVADKLFDKQNPVGKSITLGLPFGEFEYAIKGVFRENETRSHIQAHFFISMRNSDVGTWVVEQTNWATNNIFHTYIKLKAGTDKLAFEKKLQPFIDRRAGTDLKALGVSKKLFIQPVRDIHLYSDLDNEIEPNGNATYLYILGSIALFVLLIACINFMNLSTARSGNRAKEIGVRKVLGAEKRTLVWQLLGESVIMSIIALVVAVLLAKSVLPIFNNIIEKELKFFTAPVIWIWAAGLTLLTGIIAGLYPAFYLSSFQPASVLKGKLLNNFSAVAVRKGLVVFQFIISVGLVLGAIVITKQLHFLNSQELGFSKNGKLVIPLQSQDAVKNYATLKNELARVPGVKMVTSGSTYPGIANIEDMLFYAEGKSVNDVIDVRLGNVDFDYMDALGFKIIAGRGFSKDFTADSNSIVLNEAAIREFGYDVNTAVGKQVHFDFKGEHGSFRIVGIVRNFNFETLYNSIKPFGFCNYFGNKYRYAIASFSTGDYASLLSETELTWKKINQGTPFTYSFLDQDFQKNYEKDQRAAGMVGYFTIIAIVIACLGLFALSAFSAEQRTREIGIRKVLGASVSSVMTLLSREFLRLVLIGILVALPLAWFVMNLWLQDFAYRTNISWWMFALAGVIAILITLATVSFQAIKAALANPVKSLRSE